MKYTVFCDFDGTITLNDTCVELTRKYARDGWQEIERLWKEGRYSAAQLSQMILDLIEIDEPELESFARSMEIDPNFKRFAQLMESRGADIYIVSDGYDKLIEPVLSENGLLHIRYYANSIVFENGGMKAYFPNNNPDCGSCGNCKTDIIDGLKECGSTSIYIGDGYSDRCASKNGDIVFAKRDLAVLLGKQGKEFVPFEDFSDIIRYVDENIMDMK
ncbi:Haloacid Dehalogenase superfamily, subfamily IB, phosphoserine phosphatase-like/2,3-diketo-5-methylthio-1-phosphopentane phosphatase [Peptoclostridium litorale DSM 5388]|uniref:phosphoserine phosphatase n=1 Tax=Peptoclostridium litorale DSM 5388 TaxID=1121324 RepID=A0A069RB49_PEPLI|nr:MtnX-like HAD-IB family phosphatase [Peptoclostridium litorale]KDR94256.1 HAD-superfamily hydrolase, subfamily IB [Peptoclostridium litorale DSM 5388]SIO28190.1 Haloacid Dehalogenase superfamily, subfamily IB, phosphoserine phosphatase-like/2,3-diketo-5-methylthio-1-phosphopentane phosphatase [Peptoclostridium litorale DSM 5388]